MSKPKVTVLMPVYNGEQYLRLAIDSILKQTFKDFEFLIINDGSIDSTRDIILSYGDSRVQLIDNEKNIGLTRSLNKGLKLAKGEYIARQDADDISDLERLNCQVEYLYQNKEVVLVGTGRASIDSNGKEIQIVKVFEGHDSIRKELMHGNCFSHGSVMFRKIILNTVGFYREKCKYTEDYDYWCRISEKHKVANIGKTLYYLRRGIDNNISRNNLYEQINYHLLIIELAKERLLNSIDSLDTIKINNIEEVLINKYKLQPAYLTKFKSEYIFDCYHEEFKAKNYWTAIKYWWKSFLLDPQKWKIRVMFEGLFNKKNF
ncbi:Glycosyl transferase, group 2 family protein [hydrothermal vent metagenome]|uniref:Glycosyl transferase, group 2 family protein n=1 Tax=hydrothermal vent metagenome TaxID=652676 RepID=A0A3B1E051_9ZZZZ